MSIFSSINTSGSALTAQRLRMDVVSSNIANAETTRATQAEDGTWQPYQRKMVEFKSDGSSSFKSQLNEAVNKASPASGVKVSNIVLDDAPNRMVYNPSHPDADEGGYVAMPNVDPLQEMVDMMSATRSYEANVTALNASKSMLMKALEIGR
ncbi:flagellar basal body rod protein FlgC [Pontibacillus halophilus JSM 076056 = DSM 19796]|uniref:Flagellar basal-body rod protein FlgC n=1 Tax=Pontibacillus halophilus JSM 076056 = DSM 19796 TaxID=1385510 RepID=A0A0A5GMG9_9BACI|nr:flagellar basal body rod protein FlgC [Pontibacillus halophilus]KGX93174.1 flagellar basal body rod protein FlgC [Pontibacillus halophilus JSM 076056 = DSM 19796]